MAKISITKFDIFETNADLLIWFTNHVDFRKLQNRHRIHQDNIRHLIDPFIDAQPIFGPENQKYWFIQDLDMNDDEFVSNLIRCLTYSQINRIKSIAISGDRHLGTDLDLEQKSISQKSDNRVIIIWFTIHKWLRGNSNHNLKRITICTSREYKTLNLKNICYV
jgi:hypothetical protein